MKQLYDRSQVIPALGHRRVDRTAPISSRSLGIKVCATAEAASAVETKFESQVEAPRMRVDGPVTKRVYFEVFREVAVGEDVRVVGDHEELGAWDASQGLALEWHPGHVWKGSLNVPAKSVLVYKLVKAGADGICVEWEEGDDRCLGLQELPSDGISASILWGCPAEYGSCVPYTKSEPAMPDDEDIPVPADLSSDPTSSKMLETQGSYTARIAIQKGLYLGQHLKLVGSCPILGEWDFRTAPAFTWSPEHVWQLEVRLPLSEPVDWKIVQAVEGNDDWCEWQSGENTIIDPTALELSSGDVLEVGCTWDGPSRATIVETAGGTTASSGAVQPELIKVTEEAVYGSNGALDESNASTEAIASVAHAVSTSPASQAAIETQDVQEGKADEASQKPRGFDLSMFGWGAAPAEPASPPQAEPPTPVESEVEVKASVAWPAVSPAEAAPAEKAETSSQKTEVPAADKPLPVSPWDSQPAQPAQDPAASKTVAPDAEAEAAVAPTPAPPQDSNPAPTAAVEPALTAAQDSTKENAASTDAQTAEDTVKELQAAGTGLEDMLLSPEQLASLAGAGLPEGTKVTIADQDDVTFELQKGRLGKDGEGSTVIVRGGMDYDSATGTVTVNSPLGNGPDGILVDANGKTVEEVKGISGSKQQAAVKLISPENIADVKPEDEVSLVTKGMTYAGMAAAGLGAATLMGGIAVDFADVALVAGLYGVATAIGTSRNDAIRAKGGAGPVLSALVTASDIARRMKGRQSTESGVEGEKPVSKKPTIGKYDKSDTADVSMKGSMPIPTDEQIAAWQAEQAMVKKASSRAEEMQAQLGENGMHALEDGVNQVLSTDVQRILKALDSSLSDEDKVIHLVKMLLNGQPAACKTEESLQVEVRAAMSLAQEHVNTVNQSDKKAQHAPPVLLAALAMSAVDEMRGVKNV